MTSQSRRSLENDVQLQKPLAVNGGDKARARRAGRETVTRLAVGRAFDPSPVQPCWSTPAIAAANLASAWTE